MEDNGAVPDRKEKFSPDYDPEAAADANEFDDSKAKFINGGNSPDDVKVAIVSAASETSFTGLGKDELKKYADDPFWVRLRWILFILFWVGWLAMLVSAIVIIVLAPRCPPRPDLKWYHKDVAYNVYSKSFLDGSTDQDGIGDLEGIEKKVEYYTDKLEAKTLWLSSILKTEGNNDRAVIDFKMLDEKFGTVKSLENFCRRLMKKSLHVIMDLVPNQSSKNHTWFIKSQNKEGKYADYYIWSDQDKNWIREDGRRMWMYDSVRQAYYLSQFDDLPDLNLSNSDVIEEFKDIMQFWAGLGISGFHINDLEYLAENTTLAEDDVDKSRTRNNEGNVDVIDSFREIVDGLDNKPGREKLLFGTVTSANIDQLSMYYGQEGKKGLHMVALVLDQLTKNITAMDLEDALQPYTNESASGHWLGWRLTTPRPGSDRVFSRVGNERMIIAFALQTFLPGSTLPYYGDEIAMENGLQLNKKTITPMQWSKEDNAGFTTGTPWLSVNPGFETKNLDSHTAQLGDNGLMESFKTINKLKTKESMLFGKVSFCSTGHLLIFSRSATGFDSFTVVANFGHAMAHKFKGDSCVGTREMAELVFHSHVRKHESSVLNLNEAVYVNENEVLVFKFTA